MAEIYYLTKQTRDYMKLARKNILKTYRLVSEGREAAAYRCASRAVQAHSMAIQKAQEPSSVAALISFLKNVRSNGDAV